MDDDTKKLLEILRARICWAEENDWGAVWIERAVEDTGWSKAEVSGHLSVLKKHGLYERIDGFFGKVKLTGPIINESD